MAFASQYQDDFSVGMYRGRKAPPAAFYDAVNALVNDEGLPFRRGGSAYLTTSNAGGTLIGMVDLNMPITGDVTVVWSSSTVYRVNGTGFTSLASSVLKPWARGAGLGILIVPMSSNTVFAYDGNTATTITFASVTNASFVGSAGQRLLVGDGNLVWFSDRDTPATIDSTSFHQLPGRAQVTGLDGLGDTAIVFTTAGVYAIGNLSLDPVDAYGNIQQTVEQINRDVILWGDPGVASFAGGFVVPAVDDVYLMGGTGEAQPVSETIRPLYRSYVKAGYQPGTATVHRGHYWLPILNGNTLVDVLVCRLDRGQAWTRWAGHAASGAYQQRVGSSTRSPKLFAVSAQRVLDLTGTLDPDSTNAVEADGTTSDCVITTRDYPLGAQQPGFVKNARLRYELTDDGSGGTAAPTVTPAFSSDQDAGVFTTLTEKGLQGGGTGWGVSDGSTYNWVLVAKRRERIRLRITVAGACASFVLRSIELLLRPSGKQ